MRTGAILSAPGPSLTSSPSALATQSPRETISFKGSRVPVGYVAEYTVRNRTTFPRRAGQAEISTHVRLELLNSNGRRHVWMVTEDGVAQTTKGAFVRRGFLNNGKPYRQVTDEFGNLIEMRDGNPARIMYFGEFPTEPVRLGDSWDGFHMASGTRYRDVYRLTHIGTKDGRRIARIDGRLEMRGGYTLGYRIIDLSTNQELESYQHGTFTNFQGVPVEAEMHSQMVRVSTRQ